MFSSYYKIINLKATRLLFLWLRLEKVVTLGVKRSDNLFQLRSTGSVLCSSVNNLIVSEAILIWYYMPEHSQRPIVLHIIKDYWTISIGVNRKQPYLAMHPWVIRDNLLAMTFLDGVSAKIVIILWGIEALRDIEGQWPVTCPEYRAVSITTNLAEVADQVENYLRKSARSIIALGTRQQAISLCHHLSSVGICHARYR